MQPMSEQVEKTIGQGAMMAMRIAEGIAETFRKDPIGAYWRIMVVLKEYEQVAEMLRPEAYEALRKVYSERRGEPQTPAQEQFNVKKDGVVFEVLYHKDALRNSDDKEYCRLKEALTKRHKLLRDRAIKGIDNGAPLCRIHKGRMVVNVYPLGHKHPVEQP